MLQFRLGSVFIKIGLLLHLDVLIYQKLRAYIGILRQTLLNYIVSKLLDNLNNISLPEYEFHSEKLKDNTTKINDGEQLAEGEGDGEKVPVRII